MGCIHELNNNDVYLRPTQPYRLHSRYIATKSKFNVRLSYPMSVMEPTCPTLPLGSLALQFNTSVNPSCCFFFANLRSIQDAIPRVGILLNIKRRVLPTHEVNLENFVPKAAMMISAVTSHCSWVM